MSEIKVYQLNDCDWWAGHDLDSVKLAYARDVGFETVAEAEAANVFYCMHELTAEEMAAQKFVDGDDPINADGTPGGELPFREALQRMIDRGDTFPCFFASTEY